MQEPWELLRDPLQLGQGVQTPLQPRALQGGSSRPLWCLHLCVPCCVGQTRVAPGDHSPRAALQIFVRSWKKQQRRLGVTAWPPAAQGSCSSFPRASHALQL